MYTLPTYLSRVLWAHHGDKLGADAFKCRLGHCNYSEAMPEQFGSCRCLFLTVKQDPLFTHGHLQGANTWRRGRSY
jgi:hypothetical protein